MKKILGIVGCGWLGEKIGTEMRAEYRILATTRSRERAERLETSGFETTRVNFLESVDFNETFHSADVLFVSLTFPKDNADLWLNNLKKFIGNYCKPVYLCSSTGIYPDLNKTFTEEETSGLNREILYIESALREAYPQINVLRLGGLMGNERYLAKWFLGRPLPKPGATVNYIHFEDIIGVFRQMTAMGITSKVYNVVSPIHPRKNEVYHAQTGIFVDGEKQDRMISPRKIINETGYTFVHPDPVKFPYTAIRNP